MTPDQIEALLAEHWGHNCGKDECKCTCGAVINDWGNGPTDDAHRKHQAAVLADAFTKAAAAAVIRNAVLTSCDPEAYATAHNEGWDAAVAQGLTDEPALAEDWLDAKLRAAQAKALREAADALESRSEILLATMQRMAGTPGFGHDDVVRYGAYSGEAHAAAGTLNAVANTLDPIEPGRVSLYRPDGTPRTADEIRAAAAAMQEGRG